MDNTLESFINFCDDMEIHSIATEGIKDIGKSIWESVKRIFRKIVTWFGNIIRNVNYFKNATLDSQLNKDLIEVLKIAQPKTELNFGWITYYYKLASMIPKNENSDHKIAGDMMGEAKYWGMSSTTTIEDQIKRSVYDIDECLTAAQNCDAKKRLDANEYKNSQTVTIPLGQINSDLKRCHSKSTSAENELSRIENASTKLAEHTKGKELVTKAHIFYQKLSQFYKFRIELLSKFFNYAKASLKGLTNNIKDKHYKNNKLRTDFRPSNKVKFVFKSNEVKEILNVYEKAKSAPTYKEYLPYYKTLSQKFKCNGAISGIQKVSDNTIIASVNKEGEQYPLAGQSLYHHSYMSGNIKQLEPRWSTPAGVLFPTPRVYFHVGVPLNRMSYKLSKDDDDKLYTPTIKIDKVYVDKELSRTACYVVTDKPIPVKHVEYSKWERDKDIKLGFDNQN